ncbi:MAG: lipoyl(octanoyl) transferase LipB [Candidatus Omnitrophica bacterium]|nr:lipoyl(octanoyl) transferase LipB [Candidatus Omnitrophota bacterium]
MKFIDYGCLDYRKAYELQTEYLKKRIAGEIYDTVLMLEHPPVVTIGRLGSETSIIDRAALKRRGIDIIPVDRGGDATYHAPGQLVIYPIVDLGAYGRDIHRYLAYLETFLADLLGAFGLKAAIIGGRRGAWIGEKKAASIGIAVKRWVSYHGVSINVDCDLEPFSFIRVCGDAAIQVTSIARETGMPIAVTEVKERVQRLFIRRFHEDCCSAAC